jgi:2-C-methyl-D-erythritol 4-phosphate cytidylyltransferase
MVTALIFAGGVGERMNSRMKPKQFLEIHGKPIIIYTIEWFENHDQVDNICVVCLKDWIPELKRQMKKYFIHKVKWVVPGGETGHDSIYNGLSVIEKECPSDTIVLIHDGVRPLISEDLITENIRVAREEGNAITISKETESIAEVNDGVVDKVVDKRKLSIVRAPQTFVLSDIWSYHQRALAENFKSVDSSELAKRYGVTLHTVEGFPYNIKITSPSDYYIFRAIYEARENLQIFGI